MRSRFVVSAFVLAVTPALAGAATMFQVDVNGLRASAGSGFGTSYTGTVTITHDTNAFLADVLIDGAPESFSGSLASYSGSFTFAAGVITGGSYTVVVSDGSRLTGSAIAGTGSIVPQAGEGFSFDGLAFNISFQNLVGGTHFAGVNVSDFVGAPLTGSLLVSTIGIPSQGGVDNDVNFEGFVLVPSPGAFALALGGFLTLAPRRRR